jgi:hypothetical protein
MTRNNKSLVKLIIDHVNPDYYRYKVNTVLGKIQRYAAAPSKKLITTQQIL